MSSGSITPVSEEAEDTFDAQALFNNPTVRGILANLPKPGEVYGQGLKEAFDQYISELKNKGIIDDIINNKFQSVQNMVADGVLSFEEIQEIEQLTQDEAPTPYTLVSTSSNTSQANANKTFVTLMFAFVDWAAQKVEGVIPEALRPLISRPFGIVTGAVQKVSNDIYQLGELITHGYLVTEWTIDKKVCNYWAGWSSYWYGSCHIDLKARRPDSSIQYFDNISNGIQSIIDDPEKVYTAIKAKIQGDFNTYLTDLAAFRMYKAGKFEGGVLVSAAEAFYIVIKLPSAVVNVTKIAARVGQGTKSLAKLPITILKGVCSFHGNTQVLTLNGYVSIKDIRPGINQVFSKNEFTGKTHDP